MSDPDISLNDVAFSGALPEKWETVSLQQIADLGFGQSPPSATYNTVGSGLPFFQGKAEFGERYPTIEKWCTEPTRIAEAGDILMSIRAPVGPTNVAPTTCGIGRGLASIRPYSEIPTDYVLYYLRHIADRLARKGTGTTFGAITKPVVQAIQVPLAPVAMQALIASKIDELFSRIDEGERALERVQKLVERYRQSVLKAAVTGELTRDWREKNRDKLESGEALLARILKARREAWEKAELDKMKAKGITPANDKWKQKYQEPVAPDTAGLPELPKGWCWISMQQLSWASSYGTSEKCAYGTEGPAVLRIPNIRSGRFDFEDVKHSLSDLDIAAGDLVSGGDLLVVRTNGSDRIIGVGAVALAEPPFPCYFASYLIRFRLAPDAQLSAWVNYCWQSNVVRDFIGNRKASSAGQYNISQSSLMELCLPVPPVAERGMIADEIAQIISKAENAAESVSKQSGHSQALRQAVLKAAFAGRLVSRDVNDEPASTLLERITTERSQAPTKPKRARKYLPAACIGDPGGQQRLCKDEP